MTAANTSRATHTSAIHIPAGRLLRGPAPACSAVTAVPEYWVAGSAISGSMLVGMAVAPLRLCDSVCGVGGWFCMRSAASAAMQQRKHRGDKNKSGDRRETEAADNGTAQRRILFATFACSQRHRDHADDHGQRRHDDGAKPRRAGFDCGAESVAGLL